MAALPKLSTCSGLIASVSLAFIASIPSQFSADID